MSTVTLSISVYFILFLACRASQPLSTVSCWCPVLPWGKWRAGEEAYKVKTGRAAVGDPGSPSSSPLWKNQWVSLFKTFPGTQAFEVWQAN